MSDFRIIVRNVPLYQGPEEYFKVNTLVKNGFLYLIIKVVFDVILQHDRNIYFWEGNEKDFLPRLEFYTWIATAYFRRMSRFSNNSILKRRFCVTTEAGGNFISECEVDFKKEKKWDLVALSKFSRYGSVLKGVIIRRAIKPRRIIDDFFDVKIFCIE